MKPILKVEELEPNRCYWVRSKDKEKPQIELVFIVPCDRDSIKVNFGLSETDDALIPEYLLKDFDVLGPIPFMKPDDFEFTRLQTQKGKT